MALYVNASTYISYHIVRLDNTLPYRINLLLWMTEEGSTMPLMAKKKPTRKTPVYQHPRVVFHCPTELLAIVDQRAEENGRTRTSELVMALRLAYQQLGLWPPASSADTSG